MKKIIMTLALLLLTACAVADPEPKTTEVLSGRYTSEYGDIVFDNEKIIEMELAVVTGVPNGVMEYYWTGNSTKSCHWSVAKQLNVTYNEKTYRFGVTNISLGAIDLEISNDGRVIEIHLLKQEEEDETYEENPLDEEEQGVSFTHSLHSKLCFERSRNDYHKNTL